MKNALVIARRRGDTEKTCECSGLLFETHSFIDASYLRVSPLLSFSTVSPCLRVSPSYFLGQKLA